MPWPPDDPDDQGPEIPAMSWPAGHPRADYPQGFYDFFTLFAHGEFYECHETLEAVWLDTQGEERDFYQGLIHVATALHHVDRRNMSGARKLLESGLRLLEPYPAVYHSLELEAFRVLTRAWLLQVDLAWRRNRPIGIEAIEPKPEMRLASGQR